MAFNFQLGRNGKFGQIDFSKLRAGLTKDDIAGSDEFLKHIFDSFDTVDDDILSREEIQNMIQTFRMLAKNDELAKNEAKELQIDGEKIGGKNTNSLFVFINKLAETTDNVQSIQQDGETEIVFLEDGTKEELYADGSKRVTSPNGNMLYIDKFGNKIEESFIEDDAVVNIQYKDGIEVRRTITTDEKKEVIYTQDGNNIRVLENISDNITETYINGNLIKKEDKNNNTIILYRDNQVLTTVVNNDGSELVKIEDKDGNLLSQKYTETIDGSKKVTKTDYDGNNYTQEVYVNSNRTQQVKYYDGRYYSVNYDGNGNTLNVVVQNGETISQLAKKFGCSVEAIIKANLDKVKGNGSNKYFLVGEEIKIPLEVEADDDALVNRGSKESQIAAYNDFVYKKAEEKRIAEAKEIEKQQEIKRTENKKKQAEYNAKVEEGRRLAQEFYTIADDKHANKSLKAMQDMLGTKITSENIVYVLQAYNDPEIRKNDSSIIHTVLAECGNYKNKKAVLIKILDLLIQAAKNAGVSESDILNAKNKFEASLEKELKAKVKAANPFEMEEAINFLQSAIIVAQNKVENVDENQAMKAVGAGYQEINDNANEEFESARENEGWTARLGDKICGWFGCNTIEDIRAKLGDNAQKVEKLIEAANNDDKESFLRIYKELFGVEFDANKVAASEAYAETYMGALASECTIKAAQNVLNAAPNCSNYQEFLNVLKEHLSWDDETINALLEDLSSEYGRSIATDEEKQALLLELVQVILVNSQSELETLLNGKTLEQMALENEKISQAAYGMNDISRLVTQFNSNQAMVELVTDSVFEVAGTIALQFVPGVGQLAAARLATSAVKWGAKGVKLAKYAKKAANTFKAVKDIQQGTKFTSKIASKAGQVAVNVANTGAATRVVQATTNKEKEEVLRKTLMNMGFATVGSLSNILAPKIMEIFKVSSRVAAEITEEVINALGSAGVTSLAGGEYGSQDALIDFITGIIISRISGVKVDVIKNADVNTSKLELDVPTRNALGEVSNVSTIKSVESDLSSMEKAHAGNQAKANTEGAEVNNKSNTAENEAQKSASENSSTAKTVDQKYDVIVSVLDYKIKNNQKITLNEINQIKDLISSLDDVTKLKDIKYLLDNLKGGTAKTLSRVCDVKIKKLSSNVKSDVNENSTSEASEKAEQKEVRNVRARKLKDLRSKLGNKLARAYVKIEKVIENMKNAVNFDKISTSIKTKFANYKKEMNELLDKLNAKMKSLRQAFITENGNNMRQTGFASSGARPELDKYKPSRHFRKNLDHSSFVKSRSDLFGNSMREYGFWQGYTPKNQKHGAWKMHLFSVSEADWQELCDVIIPYLKEHDIDWKTFNSSHTPEMLSGKQAGKAFTIYPRNNEHMAQIAKDLDYIIRKNKLQMSNSHIVGDNQMGSTGRLFYRYEFNSGKYKDEILDLANSEDYRKYQHRYDANRGEGNYLADDMSLEDDIWRNFDPSDPNAKYETGVSASQAYNKNTARAEAYAKFDKNQQTFNLKGKGILRRDANYTLDMNDLPIMTLYDGTQLDFSTGEIYQRIKNLKNGEFFTIGRDGDIVIGNGYISRQHILVTNYNGKIVIKDISSNGRTYVRTKSADQAGSSSKKHVVDPKSDLINVFNKYLDDEKLDVNSSLVDIKKAYRKLAIKHHPDKFTTEADKKINEEIFKMIADKYDVYCRSL